MDKLKDLKFSLGSWNKVSLFLIFKKLRTTNNSWFN